MPIDSTQGQAGFLQATLRYWDQFLLAHTPDGNSGIQLRRRLILQERCDSEHGLLSLIHSPLQPHHRHSSPYANDRVARHALSAPASTPSHIKSSALRCGNAAGARWSCAHRPAGRFCQAQAQPGESWSMLDLGGEWKYGDSDVEPLQAALARIRGARPHVLW
jgi:hypothetical protein